jgi:osmotically inducible protein OsmC
MAIAPGHDNSTDEVLASFALGQHDVLVKLILRKADFRWEGGPNGGSQVVSVGSGWRNQVHPAPEISLKESSAVDPLGLIAAAHASSFSLALSDELGLADSDFGKIVTTATVTQEHLTTGWTTMNIHLNVIAKLRDVTQSEFISATVRAKTRCMVSRLLRANISMNARLEK